MTPSRRAGSRSPSPPTLLEGQSRVSSNLNELSGRTYFPNLLTGNNQEGLCTDCETAIPRLKSSREHCSEAIPRNSSLWEPILNTVEKSKVCFVVCIDRTVYLILPNHLFVIFRIHLEAGLDKKKSLVFPVAYPRPNHYRWVSEPIDWTRWTATGMPGVRIRSFIPLTSFSMIKNFSSVNIILKCSPVRVLL